MPNLEYLITRPGILKLGTIALGIVSLALSSVAYSNSPYNEFYEDQTKVGNATKIPGTTLELYHLTVSATSLSLSIGYLVLYSFFDQLCESKFNRMLDTGFHMAAALFLFAGACVNFYSAREIDDLGCSSFYELVHGTRILSSETLFCHHFGKKIVAAGFTIFNAVLYCITGFVVFTTKDL